MRRKPTALGIDHDDVAAVLEAEGVRRFTESWPDMAKTVRAELEEAC
ncbi:hypothetical protein [Actinacidiphila sp. bgisy160]